MKNQTVSLFDLTKQTEHGRYSHAHLNMTQRIAPNNQLPATHFIEVWSIKNNTKRRNFIINCIKIDYLDERIDYNNQWKNIYTAAIFRIRENKLPTLHNFNK